MVPGSLAERPLSFGQGNDLYRQPGDISLSDLFVDLLTSAFS